MGDDRVGMWGSEEFINRAVVGLQNMVDKGKLPLSRWTVEGPFKMPDSSAGGAARYTTQVAEYDVELRRYWPRGDGTRSDTFDWCFGISIQREGLVVGWLQVDDFRTPLAQLVSSVVALAEPAVEAGRRGFFTALGE